MNFRSLALYVFGVFTNETKLAIMPEALLREKVLDLESEVMRGLGSIPTRGNILSLDFFHIVKPPMPILVLLPMLCVCENTDSGFS